MLGIHNRVCALCCSGIFLKENGFFLFFFFPSLCALHATPRLVGNGAFFSRHPPRHPPSLLFYFSFILGTRFSKQPFRGFPRAVLHLPPAVPGFLHVSQHWPTRAAGLCARSRPTRPSPSGPFFFFLSPTNPGRLCAGKLSSARAQQPSREKKERKGPLGKKRAPVPGSQNKKN